MNRLDEILSMPPEIRLDIKIMIISMLQECMKETGDVYDALDLFRTRVEEL